MQGISEIFGLWDSYREMAAEIHEKPDTVLRWQLKGRIPDHAWAAVIRAGQARTAELLTVELIHRLNTPMKPRGRPSHKAAA